jgi:uncharacterized delta-60 repeat protein
MCRLRVNLFVSSWRRVVGLGVLTLVALSAASALAQPVNDYFTNATALDLYGTPGTYGDNNSGATKEPGEPDIATNAGGASVWYTWTAPADAAVTFDTIGSDFDTLLGVYVGTSVTNLHLIADDNDSGGSGTSQVTFNAAAGKTFYIAVDGLDGAMGNIVLNWNTNAVSVPATNDAFASAGVLSGDSGTVLGYNLGATREPGEQILGGNINTNSIWYTWTATSDGVVTFSTAGSSIDTVLGVGIGTNVNRLATLAQNDDAGPKGASQVSLIVTAGQAYQIEIVGFHGDAGFVELSWNFQGLPANDDFASATVLDSSSPYGSITDNNLAATAEPNEPTHAGFPANRSLWYKWTAPQDGEVQMDTMGSTFDTVLAVYTGNSIQTLSQVAANDDLFTTFPTPGSGQFPQLNELAEPVCSTNVPSPPDFLVLSNQVAVNFGNFSLLTEQTYSGLPNVSANGSGASGLRFNAKTGTTYYFAVDAKSGFGSTGGMFNLNWAYHSSGLFRFASESRDSTTGVPGGGGFFGGGAFGGGGFFLGNGSGTFPGMLLYQTAETEEFGDRGARVDDPNKRSSTLHTVYPYGAYQEGVLVTITRVGGSAGKVTVDYATVDGDQISDHYSVDPNLGSIVPDGAHVDLNGDGVARSGFDFEPVQGTLTFNDFEMSKTIVIPVFDDGRTPRPNRDFAVVLFNAQKDPGEAPSVSPPRLDAIDSQVLVRILDADLDPRGGLSQGSIIVTNTDPSGSNTFTTNATVSLNSTNAIFNFLKSNYRIPEDASDYWGNTPITVYVNRSGTNNSAASIFYRINSPYLGDQGADSEANNEFPLQPGSDYAMPTLGAKGLGSLTGGIIGGPPVDFNGADTGTLSWADKNFDAQPISFTINNDNLPEFNEDFRIELYDEDPNPTPHPVPVGMIGETTITIMFDDEDPPAGSVDQFYNPDFSLNLISSVTNNGAPIGTEPRQHPGTDANSQVNALVVQPDDLTIIGGDFTSYNGVPRNGIARLALNGELDTTFNPGDGINIVGGDFISSMSLQFDGKVVVAGSFTSFDGQPCGNVIRLNTNGTIDANFRSAAGAGANGTVRSVVVRLDGKILIGGDFTLFNGTQRKYVALLNSDGSLDTTYDPGNALNGPVYAVAPEVGATFAVNATANGGSVEFTNIIDVGASSGVLTVDYDMFTIPDDMQVYYGNTNFVGGAFGTNSLTLIYDTGSVSGTNRVVIPFGPTNGIVANTVEIVINRGNGNPGTAWIYQAFVQGAGGNRVTIGGDFTAAGGVTGQDHIARLLANGSLDTTFDPGSGANGRVRTIAAQLDGKVVLGGDFSLINGQTATHIARMNTDGTLDSGFFAGTGTDGGVYHLRYAQGGITSTQVLAGTNVTFTFTTNADTVYVGGPFTTYNGTHRLGFARLNGDGSLDTSFLDTAYNQFAGLPRMHYGDRFNAVFASGVQSDGNVMIGGSFSQVGGGQFDPNVRPELLNPWGYQEPKQRDGVRNRNNVARLIGGSTAGPGNIGLLNSSYPVTKSQGFVYTLLTRTNGALGYASANFSVVPGTAQSGPLNDYVYYASPPVYPIEWEYIGPSRMHSDGLWGTNTVMNDVYGKVWSLGLNGMQSVSVTINGSSASSGSVHANFQLANPQGADQFFLGGQNIPLGVALGRSVAPLNIADDGRKSGTFGFTAPSYASSTNASISVMRTNGDLNSSPLLVDYATSAGSNTTSGVDYLDASGTLTFNNGDTLQSFTVPIVQSNYISAVEKTVNLRLFNFPPNATTGITNAVLRIINPNFQGFLNFTSTNYVTNLSAGAIQITVSRHVGSKGTLDVQFSTADNGSAVAGVDYVGTNVTLHWNNGDVTDRTILVPFINGGAVGGSKTFVVNITNPLLNGTSAPSVLGTITNATATIVNDNNYGLFQFSSPSYVVNEASNAYATITVVRSGSTMGSGTLDFSTADGTALAGTNYIATNGTLTFVPGQTAATFRVGILNDGMTNTLPFSFQVLLSNPSPGILFGNPSVAQVNILDAQSFNRPPGSGDVTFNQPGINGDVLALGIQPDGRIIAGGNFTAVNGIPRNHVARFQGNGALDTDFLTGLSGADGSVYAVAVQSDGHILLGGAFGTVDGIVRNHIVRVAQDGTLDTSFSPGSGADGAVFSLAETFTNDTREIYVGGAFTQVQGAFHPGIVRLSDKGIIDSSFANTGVNGIVYAIAVYPTNSIFAGKVLIGGSFTTVNGIGQTNIARLNWDGTLDTSFTASADGIVRALAIQSDDVAVVGGEFAHVNGSLASRIARLNTDGTLDTAFASAVVPGIGDTVDGIALQNDNRIVVVGQFLTANGLTRHHITRLLPSGAPDPTINFGDGANGDIDAVLVQPADQMILIGGGFTQYNGQSAPYLTRIYGGSITGSGAFEFTSASYQVNENGLQAAITVRRAGGTSGPNPDGTGNTTVQFTTTPGTAVAGVNYTTVETSVSFPPGETVENVFVPILDDLVITGDKTVNVALSNPSASASLGDQTNAVLTIINSDSAISFASDSFQVAKNTPSAAANINIIRTGGTTGFATVGFATTTNGTAVIGTDYTPTNALVTFNPGDSVKTIQVAITNNGISQGDRTVTMVITNVLTNILNAAIASPSNAVLTIKDTTFSPGQLSLSTTNYFVNEGDGSATISVIRTGGSSGTVSAFYYTTQNTAIPGLNYISVSNLVSFADGQTNRTFTVPLIDNSVSQGLLNFTISLLTNSSSGTTLINPSNAIVYIADNDSGFSFVNATNTVREAPSPATATVGVIRIGPTNTSLSVDYATHDGTALAGTNYTATSGTLNFGPGQVLKSILIPVLDDPRVTGDQYFTVVLSTNSASLGAQLAVPSTNTVVILDADAGLSFTNSSMIVRRDAGTALVTVVCSNPSVEPVIVDSNTIPLSVQFATSDGSALAGVDYIAASGTMTFTNGNGTNTFLVPIINNLSVVGDRSFNVRLFNPTVPGRLVAPSNLTVTIVDGTAGFKFSNPAYSVNKTDGSAIINVYRTGLTDTLATVDFLATNGSAIDGIHYVSTNGTLVFTNGVTNQTFSVQVIDTTTVQPNKTVLLELMNPSNSVVASPSAATLTIRDNTGSFVVPAGSALVSESGAGAPNGVIDSNETVSVLFAFRDAGGLNVGNLNATLIATSGVTPSPNPATQSYGPLISGSHSVSRLFTFTALGTNGQQIAATFQLQDGTTNIGSAIFGYQLGSQTTSYTNDTAILINDHDIASPYPSTITISNLVGSVLKATLTLTNLSHASPGDIDALLVSPGQQTTLFMAHAGGQNAITNSTLTFDDAASTTLPQSGQIISGTNKPSAYLPVPIFP